MHVGLADAVWNDLFYICFAGCLWTCRIEAIDFFDFDRFNELEKFMN